MAVISGRLIAGLKMKERVAFRLDQSMIDKVAERIERDGITLSAFMRETLKRGLEQDPGLSLPVLKNIVLCEHATDEQVIAFRDALVSALNAAFDRFMGSPARPAIKGAPPSMSGWSIQLDYDLNFIGPNGSPPTRKFTRDMTGGGSTHD
jgi:hypothetical protein